MRFPIYVFWLPLLWSALDVHCLSSLRTRLFRNDVRGFRWTRFEKSTCLRERPDRSGSNCVESERCSREPIDQDLVGPARVRVETPIDRRRFNAACSSAAVAAAMLASVSASSALAFDLEPSLVWSPLGSGKTLTTARSKADASNRYSVRFVTYLTRFLLNFDSDVQQWWSQQGNAGSSFGVTEDAVAGWFGCVMAE